MVRVGDGDGDGTIDQGSPSYWLIEVGDKDEGVQSLIQPALKAWTTTQQSTLPSKIEGAIGDGRPAGFQSTGDWLIIKSDQSTAESVANKDNAAAPPVAITDPETVFDWFLSGSYEFPAEHQNPPNPFGPITGDGGGNGENTKIGSGLPIPGILPGVGPLSSEMTTALTALLGLALIGSVAGED